MSRMARFPFQYQTGRIRIIICILVGCLAVHFLVEDSFLLTFFTSPDPIGTTANQLNYDEIDHQDDMVLPASISAQVLEHHIPQMFFGTVPLKKQANTPILTPPKI